MRLAGLDISKAGLSYLAKDLRLQNKPVTFTVLKSTEGNSDSVDSDVTFKRSAFGRVNLNIDLVRRGYARVFAPEDSVHLKALQTNSAYSRLITKLLTSEKIADRRGIGVWERDSWVESVSSLPSQTTQILRANPVTKLIVSTVSLKFIRNSPLDPHVPHSPRYFLRWLSTCQAGLPPRCDNDAICCCRLPTFRQCSRSSYWILRRNEESNSRL